MIKVMAHPLVSKGIQELKGVYVSIVVKNGEFHVVYSIPEGCATYPHRFAPGEFSRDVIYGMLTEMPNVIEASILGNREDLRRMVKYAIRSNVAYVLEKKGGKVFAKPESEVEIEEGEGRVYIFTCDELPVAISSISPFIVPPVEMNEKAKKMLFGATLYLYNRSVELFKPENGGYTIEVPSAMKVFSTYVSIIRAIIHGELEEAHRAALFAHFFA